jgi:hypothetical protein
VKKSHEDGWKRTIDGTIFIIRRRVFLFTRKASGTRRESRTVNRTKGWDTRPIRRTKPLTLPATTVHNRAGPTRLLVRRPFRRPCAGNVLAAENAHAILSRPFSPQTRRRFRERTAPSPAMMNLHSERNSRPICLGRYDVSNFRARTLARFVCALLFFFFFFFSRTSHTRAFVLSI